MTKKVKDIIDYQQTVLREFIGTVKDGNLNIVSSGSMHKLEIGKKNYIVEMTIKSNSEMDDR